MSDSNPPDAAALLSQPAFTPIGLTFPPISADSAVVSGVVTLAGIVPNDTIINLISIRLDLVTVPAQVTVLKGAKSALVPAILTASSLAGVGFAAVYAQNAYGKVQGIMVITAAASANFAAPDPGGAAPCDNTAITIEEVEFDDPLKGATSTQGYVKLSNKVNCADTVFLNIISDLPYAGAFTVPASVPITQGDVISVPATVLPSPQIFKVQVAAQFQASAQSSNKIDVPAD